MMTIQKPKRMWQKKKDYMRKKTIRGLRRKGKRILQSFDDGTDDIRKQIETQFPSSKAFGTILPDYTIVADPTFTKDKTGAGEIEYFNEPEIVYSNGYKKINPVKGPSLIYNPNSQTEEDIKLDLLHHYREYDPVYQDLLKDYTDTQDPGQILYNSELGEYFRNLPKEQQTNENWNKLVKENLNGQYMVQGIDGSLRGLMASDKLRSLGRYPSRTIYEKENLNSNAARMAYQNIVNYLTSERLPEVIVKPKRYKRGKDCFDIGTDDGQQMIYQDGDQYFAGSNINAATTKVTPYIQRLPNDKSTWDFIDDSGKLYTTKYSDDQLKQLYGQNTPESEFYNWTDRSGKEHRQMKIIPVSPVDPVGEMAVETALGAPLFKGAGMIGRQFLKDYARDFAFTKLGNWTRNKIASKEAADILNKSVDSWNGVVNSNLIQNKNILYNSNNTKWPSTFTDFYKYPDALKYYEDYPEALDQLKSLKSWANTTKRDISDITLYNTPKWDSNGQGAYLGEIDYNNIISPYVDNIMRPNFKRFGIPENLQFTDKMYLTRLPKGIGGAVTNYGKYIADPINSRNLNSTVLHELGSHGTDAFISPSMQNIYDISKYLTHVRTPGSKLWYETRATKNEVGKKIFDALDNKSKKAFDLAIDNMSDKDMIRKFSMINSYGDDIFHEYFQHTPEIQKEMVDKIRYMLKYAPGLLPVLPFIRHTTQQQNHNSGKDIHIKKANRGKFTEAANEHNMGVQEFARQVLSAPKGKYSSTLRKRANFARNFAH